MFKIGTILQNANGMRAVIGAGGVALWLDTGEPVYSRLNPEEWTECEVSVKPVTVTVTGSKVRVTRPVGTGRVFDRGGCFS